MALNYLLVMPRFIANSELGYFFPLGLPYISASMKKAGFAVHTLNLNHCEGTTYSILQEHIGVNDIDVLLTGGLSPHYSIIRDIIETAKAIKPSLVVLVGGGIISSDPETAMTALEYADYGVIGEGEVTCCEFASALETGAEVAQVDGLVFKNDDLTYTITKPRKQIDNIDTIPWADYEGFEFEKALYGNPSTNGLNVYGVLHMVLSRSCPYGCTFCFHTVGKRYRQRSLNAFFDELDFMLAKYPVRHLSFIDDLFTNDPARVKGFCHRIKAYGIKWEACFRVDQVNEEMLDIVKESGCNFMTFGLESADNRVLKSMRKAITVEEINSALKLVYESSIQFMGAFIFGDREETVETATNTINWWKQHPEYPIALSRIICYPGTQLYQYACEKGVIKDKVKFLKDGCPHVNASRMTNDEFADILKEINELSVSKVRPLETYEMSNVDYLRGTFDAKGHCSKCHTLNEWKAVQIFRPSYLGCVFCGESQSIVYPSAFYEDIEINVAALLAAYDKVAVWCMSIPFQNVVKDSKVLLSDNVFFIDISEISQRSTILGKTIHSPAILDAEEIPIVICTLPTYQSTIEKRVEADHHSVQAVIQLHQLCDPTFDPHGCVADSVRRQPYRSVTC